MSRQDLFPRILGSFHETVWDDSHWPTTSALIDEACGAKGNFLGFGDGTHREDMDVLFTWLCFGGQRCHELERLYLEVYLPVDERVPRIVQLPDSRLVHVSSFFTDEEAKTSRLYNEALPLYNARNSLNARLEGPAGSQIIWAVADPVAGDGWSSHQVETIERLLPHLRQFVRVRQALMDAEALGSSLAMLLGNTRMGVIQLDRRGRIVEANDEAADLLRRRDGLVARTGFLHASLQAEDESLQKLLSGALQSFGGQGVSGSLAVTREGLSPRLALHVSPVSESRRDSLTLRVAVIVLVVDPLREAPLDPALVAATFGLTPAESHVVVLLAQGRTVRDIAGETGRSETTIKWHLRNIFDKCGLSRQVDLMQLAMSLANVPKSPR